MNGARMRSAIVLAVGVLLREPGDSGSQCSVRAIVG